MAKESLYGIERRLVFRETFESEESVRRNGGVPTGVNFSNGSANFNGTTSLILKDLYLNVPISIRIKLKANSTIDGNKRDIAGNKLSAGNYPALTFTGTTFAFYCTAGTERIFSGTYSKNVWYDVVYTLASGSQKLYVNGVADATTIAVNLFNFHLKCIGNIDSDLGVSRPFDGQIELLEIYSGTLTAQEVKNLYENKRHRELMPNKGEQLGADKLLPISDVNGWSTDSGVWSIGDVVMSYNNLVNSNVYSNSFASLSGLVKIVVTQVGTGRFAIVNQAGSALIGYETRPSGTYTFYYTASSITRIGLREYATYGAFSITEFSLKEVPVTSTKEILNISAINGVVRNKYSGDTINGVTVPSVVPTAVSVVKENDVLAMKFNGSTSKIDCGSYDTLVGDKTFVVWIGKILIELIPPGSYYTIFSNNNVLLRIRKNNRIVYFSSNGFSTLATGWAITGELFNQIIVTRTSVGIANIYINGILSGTANQSSGTPVAGSNINIGYHPTHALKGYIDNPRIIDGILTPEEISQLYTNEKDKYGL